MKGEIRYTYVMMEEIGVYDEQHPPKARYLEASGYKANNLSGLTLSWDGGKTKWELICVVEEEIMEE